MMTLSSLGFTEGMIYGMCREASDGPKVLDWEKTAEIVNRTSEDVWAGLKEDWECTSGLIAKGGNPTSNERVYVWSRWATPVVVVGDQWGDEIECWKPATGGEPSGCPKGWGA